jgi:hypothetical protein
MTQVRNMAYRCKTLTHYGKKFSTELGYLLLLNGRSSSFALGRDISVRTATLYGLDCTGIESRW